MQGPRHVEQPRVEQGMDGLDISSRQVESSKELYEEDTALLDAIKAWWCVERLGGEMRCGEASRGDHCCLHTALAEHYASKGNGPMEPKAHATQWFLSCGG